MVSSVEKNEKKLKEFLKKYKTIIEKSFESHNEYKNFRSTIEVRFVN